MDFSSAITAATSSAVTDYTTNLTAVIPVLLGLAVTGLIVRRVLRFVR